MRRTRRRNFRRLRKYFCHRLAGIAFGTEGHVLEVERVALELAENQLANVAVELVIRLSSGLRDHRKLVQRNASSAHLYIYLAGDVSRIGSRSARPRQVETTDGLRCEITSMLKVVLHGEKCSGGASIDGE